MRWLVVVGGFGMGEEVLAVAAAFCVCKIGQTDGFRVYLSTFIVVIYKHRHKPSIKKKDEMLLL